MYVIILHLSDFVTIIDRKGHLSHHSFIILWTKGSGNVKGFMNELSAWHCFADFDMVSDDFLQQCTVAL